MDNDELIDILQKVLEELKDNPTVNYGMAVENTICQLYEDIVEE